MDLPDAFEKPSSVPQKNTDCPVFRGPEKEIHFTVNYMEYKRIGASDGSVPCCEHAACTVFTRLNLLA